MSLSDYIYVGERLGKDQSTIKVPKIRTMYPKADQDYPQIITRYALNELGKPDKDPRVIPARRWLRESHLDELPQLFYNVLFKRNMKLVGIRARTSLRWGLFPRTHKQRCLKHKPALAGINYSDINSSIRKVEKRYLARKKLAKNRLQSALIDFTYLMKIVYNKTFLGQRSH